MADIVEEVGLVKTVNVEIVANPPTPATTKAVTMQDMVKSQDLPLLAVMETMDSLDWKALRPHQTALLLMQKPFPASGGGQMFLSFRQAILFAVRCAELGVSPFSGEAWFDPNRATTNLTLEGKRQVLQNRKIDVGPPIFEELSREWQDIARITDVGKEAQKLGFVRDAGIKCKIRVGDPSRHEFVEYTAWLSEWLVPKSPVWLSKTNHMLCTRAQEKAITIVLGTGSSSMPDEQDLS